MSSGVPQGGGCRRDRGRGETGEKSGGIGGRARKREPGTKPKGEGWSRSGEVEDPRDGKGGAELEEVWHEDIGRSTAIRAGRGGGVRAEGGARGRARGGPGEGPENTCSVPGLVAVPSSYIHTMFPILLSQGFGQRACLGEGGGLVWTGRVAEGAWEGCCPTLLTFPAWRFFSESSQWVVQFPPCWPHPFS